MLTRVRVLSALLFFLAAALFRTWYGRYTLNLDEPLIARAEASGVTAVTRKVLLVVLDGARFDAVPRVPTLVRLSQGAAVAELTADLPTISAAQYVSLLTGVTPQDSGRRSNDALRAVPLETLPELVRRANGRTAAFSDCVDWWWRLFPGAFDVMDHSDPGATLAFARAGRPDFLLVHLCAFDEAGHTRGAATDAYRVEAAQAVDRTLVELLEAWGDAGPVVITSDHGHRDRGGHGGDEPEVSRTFAIFSGPGAAPGARAKGRAIDLAPTVAALMGLPAPGTAEGRTLTALLEPPDTGWQHVEEADAQRTAAVKTSAEHRRAELEGWSSVARVLRGLAVLTLALLLAVWLRRDRRSALRGLLTGAAMLAVSCAAYFVVVGPVSLSAERLFGRLLAICGAIGFAAACACVVAPLIAVWRRDGRDGALWFVLGAAAGSSPLAAWVFVVFGLASARVSVDDSAGLALPSLAWSSWAGMLTVLLGVAVTASVRRAPEKAARPIAV